MEIEFPIVPANVTELEIVSDPISRYDAREVQSCIKRKSFVYKITHASIDPAPLPKLGKPLRRIERSSSR